MLAAAIGGLISAALNRPFQIFYLLPALPPLFVLAALMFDERRPVWLTGIWGLSIVAGLVPVGAWVVHAANAGIMPALDAQRRADALGAALRANHIQGSIATLAGQFVPDAGRILTGGSLQVRSSIGLLTSSRPSRLASGRSSHATSQARYRISRRPRSCLATTLTCSRRRSCS